MIPVHINLTSFFVVDSALVELHLQGHECFELLSAVYRVAAAEEPARQVIVEMGYEALLDATSQIAAAQLLTE